MTTNLQQRRLWRRLLVLACLSVSLFCVLYPIYVIRPFRAQGESELAVALLITRFRPAITIISAAIVLMAAIGYWRDQLKKPWKILAAAGAVFACVLAILARVNVYELMFHRIDRPSFVAASQVKLDQDEKVIAVKIGSQGRAYPIRSISYHHIVNDEVDHKAIVATY